MHQSIRKPFLQGSNCTENRDLNWLYSKGPSHNFEGDWPTSATKLTKLVLSMLDIQHINIQHRVNKKDYCCDIQKSRDSSL